MTYAHVLPHKGVTQGPIGSKCLLNDLKELGYPKMVMCYDLEPALNSVVEAAKNGFDKELVLEKVPRGVSEPRGEIERAVQTIESQSRTLRSALDTSYGRKAPDDHPVLTWLNMQASRTICFIDLWESKMGKHRALDTVVVSGECQYHHLERQLSFSKEVTSLKQDGTKEFVLESKTIPLRR